VKVRRHHRKKLPLRKERLHAEIVNTTQHFQGTRKNGTAVGTIVYKKGRKGIGTPGTVELRSGATEITLGDCSVDIRKARGTTRGGGGGKAALLGVKRA